MYFLILISATTAKYPILPAIVLIQTRLIWMPKPGLGQLRDERHHIQDNQAGTANHSPMTCARLTCRLPGS